MKFKSKLAFMIGILAVVLLVIGLTLFLSASMSVVQSSEAALDARSRTIGTDYPGRVIAQNVEEGDVVAEGDVMFEIDSAQLRESLNNGSVLEASLPFTLTDNKAIELVASEDGVVNEITYSQGSFVPVGGVVASIYTAESLFVTADFQLSPPDYARIDETNSLELLFPDNSRKEATITSVSLVRNPDTDLVDTVIEAKLNDAEMTDFRFSAGTPVQATLKLNQEAWYQNLVTFVQNLFTPKD